MTADSTTISTARLSHFVRSHLDVIARREQFTTYSLEQRPASAKGDGFTATMVAITIAGEKATTGPGVQHQLPLVCKILPASSVRQEQFHSAVVFEREVFAYQRILPALEKFQTDRGLGAANGFRAYPRCYSATYDANTAEAVIILQDLRAGGYEMWPRTRSARSENVKMLLEKLGTLHAVSMAMREQRPEVFAELEELPDLMGFMLNTSAIRAWLESAYERAERVMVGQAEDAQLMARFRRDWFEMTMHSERAGKSGAFRTISHGDCWSNNFMYRLEGGIAQDVCLLDWQLTRLSSPATDLSYFLFSSTEKPLRDRHLNTLLHIYYNRFASTVRQCGSDPETLFTFEDLRAELRDHGLYGVLMAPLMISVMVSETDRIASMEEMAQTLHDGQTQGSHIAELDEQSERQYRQRLGDILADARKLGILLE